MITYIEVLDTAVKIGLGALITAVAGQIATKTKSRLDQKHEREKYFRSLVERLSIGFEDCVSNLIRIIINLQQIEQSASQVSPESVKHIHQLCIDAYNQSNTVDALANLVGTPETKKTLDGYGEYVSELLELAIAYPQGREKIPAVVEKLNDNRGPTRAAIRAVFDSIHI